MINLIKKVYGKVRVWLLLLGIFSILAVMLVIMKFNGISLSDLDEEENL